MLRKRKVVGKFVEFFGPGVQSLNLADRATIANMAPEYGATMGFFPIDTRTVDYLRQTGRDDTKIQIIEHYFKANGLFRVYDGSQADPEFTGEVLTLDLSTISASLAGPKRPMDRVALKDLAKEFSTGLTQPVNFKNFGVAKEKEAHSVEFVFQDEKYTFKHGTVVIAAITSCTNTSNPGVMLAAGLLARNAVKKGLVVPKYVKTSLSPGS
jgi:aconitate hydratase